MIIGVAGYGYSGSSAVIDLLKEVDSVSFVPGEFQILRRVHSICSAYPRPQIGRMQKLITRLDRYVERRLDTTWRELPNNSRFRVERLFDEFKQKLAFPFQMSPQGLLASSLHLVGYSTKPRRGKESAWHSPCFYYPKRISKEQALSHGKHLITGLISCFRAADDNTPLVIDLSSAGGHAIKNGYVLEYFEDIRVYQFIETFGTNLCSSSLTKVRGWQERPKHLSVAGELTALYLPGARTYSAYNSKTWFYGTMQLWRNSSNA